MRILLFILLLLIPLVAAAELQECPRVLYSNEVPCTVLSSYKPDAGCTGQVFIYFENETLVQTKDWKNSTPFCKFHWNISQANSTYVYNSSIESGVINIIQEDNMLSIIILQVCLIAFFILIGIPHKFGFVKFLSWSLALLEIVMSIWIVYLNELSISIINYLYINSLIALFCGGFIGLYTIIMLMVRLSKPDEKVVEDDGYSKFVYGK